MKSLRYTRDELLTELYNIHYTAATRQHMDEIEAMVYAHDRACQDLRGMNPAELRVYLRQHQAT